MLRHGRHQIRQNVRGFRTLSGGIRFTNIALVLEKQYIKLYVVLDSHCPPFMVLVSVVLAYIGEVFHLLLIHCRFVKKNIVSAHRSIHPVCNMWFSP